MADPCSPRDVREFLRQVPPQYMRFVAEAPVRFVPVPTADPFMPTIAPASVADDAVEYLDATIDNAAANLEPEARATPRREAFRAVAVDPFRPVSQPTTERAMPAIFQTMTADDPDTRDAYANDAQVDAATGGYRSVAYRVVDAPQPGGPAPKMCPCTSTGGAAAAGMGLLGAMTGIASLVAYNKLPKGQRLPAAILGLVSIGLGVGAAVASSVK